ncbi:MAG: hypothetical protein JWN66_3912 [Sphingomonas bacterium]|jgi:hypothetical protein|uniref:hypothetical protein n=1 Tax=Sphingomonas bacterium TaxID=1895847 RepID=UPI00260FE417|nr:hypothetical protein [Sphingomonas bacterium]MDB5706796.1 hypothetical protein [Sphingomonas bacterium]
MTHQPPLPAAATPPYPLHPEPHEESAPAFFAHGENDGHDDASQYTLAERFSLPDILSSRTIGLAAAIGLGVAAIAGALIYGTKPRRAAPPASKARTPARRHKAERKGVGRA